MRIPSLSRSSQGLDMIEGDQSAPSVKGSLNEVAPEEESVSIGEASDHKPTTFPQVKAALGNVGESVKQFTKRFESEDEDAPSLKERICRSMVEKPLTHYCGYWAFMIVLLMIVGATDSLGVSDPQIQDFLVSSQQDVKNFFALNEAEDTAEGFEVDTEVLFRDEEVITPAVFFLYEPTGSELMTLENVKAICEVEAQILKAELYPSFCLVADGEINNGSSTICGDQQLALTQYFYNGAFGDALDCEDIDQDTVDVTLAFLLGNEILGPLFFDNLDDPSVTRSTIFLAGPLGADSPPFEDFLEAEEDPYSDQYTGGYAKITEQFVDNLFDLVGVSNGVFRKAFNTKFFKPPNSSLRLRVYGFEIEILHFDEVIVTDQAVAAGSFIVVSIVVFYYVGSCFLATFAMLAIAFSMVGGIFLYAVVFQINFFNTLHIVVLFVVFAIGANNFFVLVDAWRQSEAHVLDEIEQENKSMVRKYKRRELGLDDDAPLAENNGEKFENDLANEVPEKEILVRRLTYAYGRAALSVANTALTTLIAFAATGVSDLPTVAAFGIFAAITIFVNFLYMFNIQPALVILHHIYFVMPAEKKKKAKEEAAKAEKATEDNTSAEKDDKLTELESDAKEEKKVKEEPLNLADVKVVEEDQQSIPQAKEAKKLNIVDRGFKKYIDLVRDTYFPHIALALTFIYGVGMTISALRLETPTSVESNFLDSHMFTGFEDDFNNLFSEGSDDTFSGITAVFGIQDLDDSDVPRFSSDEFRGDPVYDEDFEIFSETSQNFLFDYCAELPNRLCDADACNFGTLILERAIDCWIDEFRTFYGDNITYTTFENGTETGLSDDDVLDLISDFLQSENGTDFVDSFGFIDGELKYTTFFYRMTMKENQPLSVKEPVFELLEEFDDDMKEAAPPGMNTFFQTSFDIIWQHSERSLVSGLYQGMGISLAASFVIIYFGTRNLVVSVFAIAAVGLVVMCVLGSVQTLGWSLGTVEAVAGVMVIGLAVDYTVHLGVMFIHSKTYLDHHDVEDLLGEADEAKDIERQRKAFSPKQVTALTRKDESFKNADMVEYAVDRMGVTILAGAATTFSSGAFLLICTFAFFFKMAVLIILTVLYSFIYAFFFFVPLLRVFGPGER